MSRSSTGALGAFSQKADGQTTFTRHVSSFMMCIPMLTGRAQCKLVQNNWKFPSANNTACFEQNIMTAGSCMLCNRRGAGWGGMCVSEGKPEHSQVALHCDLSPPRMEASSRCTSSHNALISTKYIAHIVSCCLLCGMKSIKVVFVAQRCQTQQQQACICVQAVEAKENLTIGFDSMTQASVTFQMFFRYYTKLAGMTVLILSRPSPLSPRPVTPLCPHKLRRCCNAN